MVFSSVRNYLQERQARIKYEWKIFQQAEQTNQDPSDLACLDSDLERLHYFARDRLLETQKSQILEHEFNGLMHSMQLQNNMKKRPYQFSSSEHFHGLPSNREPAPGIVNIPRAFHPGQIVSATEELPETGFELHPLIKYLLEHKYMHYQRTVDKYVRPLGTTDSTFADFNREQIPSAPIPKERKERIMKHVHKRLNTSPYLPLHFVDTQYAKLPLHTGTGYHNRHSFKTRAHAKYSHPEEYAHRATSKGYYLNAFLELARTLIHRIKESGLPFEFIFNEEQSSEEQFNALASQLSLFIDNHATMLFTRNHISERDKNLKQRPVYAVDELFILIEIMLTFPLLVMARKPECCIMYGLETIRGAMNKIDSIAKEKGYTSFFTIDWSAFDQRLPRVITDLYYTEFLESLIVISHGYQPTREYPTYPDLTEEKMFTRMSNLLQFLHTWYNNMTFVTADGYAYRRTCAGVPSGLYNTQYLDSFGNLFLIIDALIEFGCTDEEIEEILLFIMGDDNSGFTYWSIERLDAFISFLEKYALQRYNMVLSKTKSVITVLRSQIEMLSYKCNSGRPTRSLEKLIAQLCYPERGPKDKYMSYRAIGIAYAAAGMDNDFHEFCLDVYSMFKPFAAPLTEENLPFVKAYLPGYLKAPDLPEVLALGTFIKFPTIDEVIDVYSRYAGPLDYAPKWNFAHFINAPNVVPPSTKTIRDYRIEHEIPCPPVPTLPIIG
uniref:RNA dependent RNA polymerase n=1 Tax=Rosellinia necatrix partitivirus 21 TaxID=2699389 RepID=A0A6F8QGN0_9VIRU|nr:RNA dependent RNA polymerase [Rosellinia necatrix partitivirus 21]